MKHLFKLVFILLLLKHGQTSGVAECQIPAELLNLVDLQGEVRYNGTFRHDRCSWNLPTLNSSNYILLIYVKDLQMMYHDLSSTGCSGNIILPETTPFCRMPTNPCFLYSTQESVCTLSQVSNSAKNFSTACSSVTWLNVNTLPRTMRVEATAPDYKEFTLHYKFITCYQPVLGRNSVDAGSTTTKAPSDKRNQGESTTQSYETAFIAVLVVLVIALLLLLVVLTCALKKYMRRRNRSEKPRSSTPPEYSTGIRVASNQYDSRPEEAASDGDIPINEYAEIPTDRFSSNSREVVRNAIY